MNRVLVTGASGYVGRAVVSLLVAHGWEVHGVCRPVPPDAPPGATWHEADLLAPATAAELMERIRPTHLIHLAWIATPGVYWTSPDNDRWVDASLLLADAFHAAGGQRIVVAGTCAEYQWGNEACREAETPLVPATPYGKAKLALFRALSERCDRSGTQLAWGRIFHSFGPYEHPSRLVPSVIRSLLAGEEARTTAGEQVRGFLHVSDVAEAFVSLLDATETGAFNIGASEPMRIADLVLAIADQLDARDRVRLGALPTSPNDPPLLIADDRRLRQTGWKPSIPLDKGIGEAIDWWRDELRHTAT